MKKTVIYTIVLALIITSKVSLGQDYFPFPTESANWSVFSRLGAWPPPATESTFQYFINGDTIIDSLNYSKIFSWEVRSSFDTIIDTAGAIYLGGLREDTNKHIYYKPGEEWQSFSNMCYIENWTLDEFLLYKFDINVGDTFELNDFWYNSFVVYNIDTIQVDSSFRKRYHLYNDGDGDKWVEGIGSMTSLFGSVCNVFEGQEYLLCYKDSSTFFVGEQNNYNRCTHIVVGQNEYSMHKLNIHPNPANNELFFNSAVPLTNYLVIIYNTYGQEVLTTSLTENSINISKLKRGIYIVEVSSNKRKIIEKLIIEK